MDIKYFFFFNIFLFKSKWVRLIPNLPKRDIFLSIIEGEFPLWHHALHSHLFRFFFFFTDEQNEPRSESQNTLYLGTIDKKNKKMKQRLRVVISKYKKDEVHKFFKKEIMKLGNPFSNLIVCLSGDRNKYRQECGTDVPEFFELQTFPTSWFESSLRFKIENVPPIYTKTNGNWKLLLHFFYFSLLFCNRSTLFKKISRGTFKKDSFFFSFNSSCLPISRKLRIHNLKCKN